MSNLTTDTGGAGTQGQYANLGLPPPSTEQKPQTEGQIQTQSSAGTSTVLGKISQEISTLTQIENANEQLQTTANVDPNNPTIAPPNTEEANLSNAELANFHACFMLGSLYGVALEEVMSAMMKQHSFEEMMDSQLWVKLETKDLKDLANTISSKQLEQGKIEEYTSFAKAFCCGIQAGMSVAGMGASFTRFGDSRTQAGMFWSSLSQGVNGIAGSDSVASNLASGIGANMKAEVEATLTQLQYMQQLLKDMSERVESDRKDSADVKNQALQNLMKWMDSIYQLASGRG